MGGLPPQLLITNIAQGSFGFELEEREQGTRSLDQESVVATALARTQALLQGTQASDEALVDAASETRPRALEKVRAFLRTLSEGGATCALMYGEKAFRFSSTDEVRRSLERLEVSNLKDSLISLQGEFTGLLPGTKVFEFRLTQDGQRIQGKVEGREILEWVRNHLDVPVSVSMTKTEVKNARPRYTLAEMPEPLHNGAPVSGSTP